ncbi:hypothetical protein ACFQE1_01890 [Halobium palmae]|uniref:Heme exporter protein D n=1 Tax=Halobium palmae TaxID=1776492 RepID=A0ABD5RVH2_9EURY
MVYELSATTFSVFAYVVLTWTAIMALFIVGTTFWQMNQVFGKHRGGQPAQPVGGDD